MSELTGFMSFTGSQNEDNGPSVDSEDLEERIAARRIRIEERLQTQKKLDAGDVSEEAEPDLNPSCDQIKLSQKRIGKLVRDADQLKTNVRAAREARDTNRLAEESLIRKNRNRRIESEASHSDHKFEQIIYSWTYEKKLEMPLELQELFDNQKQDCAAVIGSKNQLINDLQLELKSKDDLYVKELKKQSEDVDLMIERMDEEIRIMTSIYRDELVKIEEAFIEQRSKLMNVHAMEWESTMQKIRDYQTNYLDAREKRRVELGADLNELSSIHAEEYNSIKIKLDMDIQVLEQQLQMMKATCQLNLEKLEYNFQVLKKRDEENTATKSQQKRKITRLQDVLNTVKVRMRKQEKQYISEFEQTNEDIARVLGQRADLQKKSKRLLGADAKKFHDIWLMNEEEIRQLSYRLIEADRIITEQQLGLEYTPPDTSFMMKRGPIHITSSSESKGATFEASTRSVVEEILLTGSDIDHRAIESEGYTIRNIGSLALQQILDYIYCNCNYLSEEKMQTLMKPVSQEERLVMQLDNIFMALGVNCEDDLNKMIRYFIKSCTRSLDAPPLENDWDISEPSSSSVETSTNSKVAPAREVKFREEKTSSITGTVEEQTEEMTKAASRQGGSTNPNPETTLSDVWYKSTGGTPTPNSTGKSGGSGGSGGSSGGVINLVHPTETNKVVRRFLAEFYGVGEGEVDGRLPVFRLTGLEHRDDTDDAQYWNSYNNSIVSADKEIMWDALTEGLDRYYSLLTLRYKWIVEVDAYKVQNAELHHLLNEYRMAR